jgi:hypothetical protein
MLLVAEQAAEALANTNRLSVVKTSRGVREQDIHMVLSAVDNTGGFMDAEKMVKKGLVRLEEIRKEYVHSAV